MLEEITLNIDGQEVKTTKDKTVIEAARDAGIYIPYLCWHPMLKQFGACRMCVVEIDKMRGLPASCTTQAMDGMVVKTKTAEVDKTRKEIMDLILSEHPHGCLTCPRIDHCGPMDTCLRHANVVDRCVLCPQNERCELQDVVFYLNMKDSELPYTYRHVPLDTSNPFIDHDMNLCIVCGRCVRACNEIEWADAITFIERGEKTLIGTSLGGSLSDSGCTFCGACVEVCPVGAITEKDFKFSGAPQKSVTTICSHCSVGCQLELLVKNSSVIRSIGDLNGPVNRGNNCARGKFGFFFIKGEERLEKPLIRRNGQFEEATWDEAISYIAENLSKYKGNSFGAIASARGTNEENYLLQKFTRQVMGSQNIDHIDYLCDAKSVAPLGEMVGAMAATNTFWETRESKAILAVGTDMTSDHPVAALSVKEAVRRGARLVVIDSRETELALLATHWLRPKPGSEVVLLAGIAKQLMDERVLDQEFIDRNTEGLEELKKSLSSVSLEQVAKDTGIEKDRITEGAGAYAENAPAATFYATNALPRGAGAEATKLLTSLALLTGNLGKPSAGVFPLRGEANSQGATDMSCVPGENGMGYQEMMDGARRGDLKAMFISADTQRVEETLDLEALEALEFLVVQDLFMTEAAKRASAILPAAAFAEKDGTYTNIERRVQQLRRVIEPRGEARSLLQTITALAKGMGAEGFGYSIAADVMEEIASKIPTYSGISYPRMGYRGLQWPCPSDDHSGISILHSDGMAGGKAKFLPVSLEMPSAVRDAEHAFIVLTCMLREMKGVVELEGSVIATLNHADAHSLDIKDDDEIEVATKSGKVAAKARVGGDSPRGVIFLQYPHTKVLEKTLYSPPANAGWNLPLINYSRAKVNKLIPSVA